jgi:hypothetical protein
MQVNIHSTRSKIQLNEEKKTEHTQILGKLEAD